MLLGLSPSGDRIAECSHRRVLRLFRFPAVKLNNRRVCSALQGIGGRATNKQDAKSTTLALLATIETRLLYTSLPSGICSEHLKFFIRYFRHFFPVLLQILTDFLETVPCGIFRHWLRQTSEIIKSQYFLENLFIRIPRPDPLYTPYIAGTPPHPSPRESSAHTAPPAPHTRGSRSAQRPPAD